MSFLRFNFSTPTAVHPLMQAYYACDTISKDNSEALEELFSAIEKDLELHLFLLDQESFFLEDVNELISKYPTGIRSHYSMRLSRIAYNVAEKLEAAGHSQESKSYRDWAPKIERFAPAFS